MFKPSLMPTQKQNSVRIHQNAKSSVPTSTSLKKFHVFDVFKKVEKEDLKLLGSPVLKGPAVDKPLNNKVAELKSAIGRRSLLHANDAHCLLRNALAMSNLLYIFRTAPCSNNPRLSIFDDTLRQGLSTILNVSLSDDQWLQASLPVQNGGLGIRSAGMLATFAYLASAAATLRLQNAILANSCFPNSDSAVGEAFIIWKTQSHTVEPASPADQY